MDMLPNGLLLAGTFAGVKQVRRGDGSAVDGLYELKVSEPPRYDDDDEPYTHKATFFETTRQGKSPIATELETLVLAKGDPIIVTVHAKANGGFLNLSARSVMRQAPPGKASKTGPVAVAS